MEIKKHLTNINYSKTDNKNNKYIVVHYTANNNDTALNNCKYFETLDRGASANYFVDENEIYQCVEDHNVAWHCGKDFSKGKAPYWIKCTNYNSIGIEMCNSVTRNEKVENKTIELIVMLMNKYNIPLENVIRHYDVCGKDCPLPYLDDDKWNEFKDKVNFLYHINKSDVILNKKYWFEHFDYIKGLEYLDTLIIKLIDKQ